MRTQHSASGTASESTATGVNVLQISLAGTAKVKQTKLLLITKCLAYFKNITTYAEYNEFIYNSNFFALFCIDVRCNVLCCVKLYCVVFRFVVLCIAHADAVVCYVVFCFALLCCVVL